MGPGGEVLDHAVHAESSQDPGEPRPRGEAALPAALPAGDTLSLDQTDDSGRIGKRPRNTV